MSRAELAEAVCAWLWETTKVRYDLDGHYVAKLERGMVKWPTAPYRSGLRHVLGVQSDAELGFYRSSRGAAVPVRDDERLPFLTLAGSTASTEVTAFLAMSHAFQAADRQVGGGVLYPTVVRYLNTEVAPRLLDPDSTSGAAMFVAASSLTEIAGWMAHDTGQDARARQHFDKAFRLASAAGHDPLAGNICASLSHLAVQFSQPADAVRIADAGLARATRTTGTRRLVARLHAMRARALSVQGDAAGCITALDDAQRTLDNVHDEEPAEWIANFDDASLAGEAALCFRQLGHLTQAEQYAHRVIELRSGDRVRSRAFGQLTLARVLVDAGRHDEAATVGQEVCAVAPSLTSARVRVRLDRLGDILTARRESPDVAAFLADLDSLHSLNEPPIADGASWPV
jgi:tetratricopeptide (TPR) repeat protein